MSRLLPLSDAAWPARLAPGLFVLIWATGFVVARLVARACRPLTFLCARFGLTTLVLTGLAASAGATWPRAGAAGATRWWPAS